MLADIHILHRSDFYRVTDFKCHCNLCSLSEPEYSESMCVSFIRKGFFEYQTFRRKDEVHVGRLLISKPGFEHVTRHIDAQPDITSVFEFTVDFFQSAKEQYGNASWFLKNNDIHSVLLQSNPELDYLHHCIWKQLEKKSASGLQTDEMVMELFEKVMNILTNTPQVSPIAEPLIRFHLGTIEDAKNYMLENLGQPVSLQQLARHCMVSPFHFSRIFKSVMNISPHKYLTEIRLNHAKILLSTTSQSVTDISFDCGFNSIEHFATAYRQRYHTTPSKSRGQHYEVITGANS